MPLFLAGCFLLRAGDTGGVDTPHPFCRVEHAPDIERTEGATAVANIGDFSALVLLVDFPDLPGGNTTTSNALSVMQQVDLYYRSNSFQKFSISHADATPVMRLPRTGASYLQTGPSTLMEDARTAARGFGFNPASYRFVIVTFAHIGFPWGGLGYIGGNSAFVQDAIFRLGTVQHEIGHSLGLWHAGGWFTADESMIGSGQHLEYGNEFDIMGSGPGHFNGAFKLITGWLENAHVATATTNGVYRIYAMDTGNPLTPGETYVLQIPAGAPMQGLASDYWIDFRQQFAMHGVSSGGLLHWTTNTAGSDHSHLLDMNPAGVNGFRDAALMVGRTFTDATRRIHITPVAKGDQWLDIAVKLRPTNASVPSVTLQASASAVKPGESVQFTASATDADGDALAYFWDFDDGTVAASSLNQPAATKSWTSPREYLVRCVVSDMKGGQASASALVRVGVPSTYHIAGRVVPSLDGVRVHNGLTGPEYRGTFTDSDGRFALTGLPSGSYWVGAARPGYSFEPLFANPLTVGPLDVEGCEFQTRTGAVLIVRGFSPISGSVGSAVTIHGANFLNITAVRFGNISAVFTNESSERIRAWVPSGAEDRPITVTGFAGTDSSYGSFDVIPSAPVIVRDPASQTNGYTLSTLFRVEVSGSGPLTYQWRHEGTDIPNATNTDLPLVNLQSQHAGRYDVIAHNPAGSITSAPALLTLETRATFAEMLDTPGLTWITGPTKPWITQSNVTHDGVDAAASAALEPFAEESWLETTVNFTEPQLMRFWRHTTGFGVLQLFRGSGTNMTPVLSWSESFLLPAGEYRLRFSASRTSTHTAPYRVWVDQVSFEPGRAPVITREPEDVTVPVGDSATLYVEATGTLPLSYQWYRVYSPQNIQPIWDDRFDHSVFGPTLINDDVSIFDEQLPYFVVVANQFGSVTSRWARITAYPRPAITVLNPSPDDEVPPVFNLRLQVTSPLTITNVALWQYDDDDILRFLSETSTPEPDGTFLFTVTNLPGRRVRYSVIARDSMGGTGEWRTLSFTCVSPIVTSGAAWKFLDTGADMGADWRLPEFDDSEWAFGWGPFGFGDFPGANGTIINNGRALGESYITTYFRKRFEVSDVAALSNIVLHLHRLGGVVVYLNGSEIWRRSMPAGPIDFGTWAASDAELTQLSKLRVESSWLRPGTNLLAAEIHLAGPWSPSMVFELSLVGNSAPGPPTIAVTVPRYWETTLESYIEVIAEVFDPDNDIASVSFYLNNIPFAQRTAPPWSAILSNLPPVGHLSRFRGPPRINCTVIDSRGASHTTESIYLDEYEGQPGTLDISQLGWEWHYHWNYDNVDPGTAWREDPGAALDWRWSYVRWAPLFMTDDFGKERVTRYRRVFDLPVIAAYTNIILSLLCEESDGAIVYFNGVEILRYNLPPGPLATNWYTGGPPGWYNYVRTNVTPALLRTNDNLLAVEMYQNRADSDRLTFDLGLMGQVPLTDPRLMIERIGDYVYLKWDWNYWYSGILWYGPSPDSSWEASVTGRGGASFLIEPEAACFFRFQWHFSYSD